VAEAITWVGKSWPCLQVESSISPFRDLILSRLIRRWRSASERELAEAWHVRDFALLESGGGVGCEAVARGALWRSRARAGDARDYVPLVNYGPGEEEIFSRAVLAASGGAARRYERCSITELIASDAAGADCSLAAIRGRCIWRRPCGFRWWRFLDPRTRRATGLMGREVLCLRSAESVTSHARRAAATRIAGDWERCGAGLIEV
jgi:hypothetical protein